MWGVYCMKITVLGCYGPYPPAGQCCSGYLLQDQETAILLDCGNGVFSRLRYYLEPWELSAVIVTHLHADHYGDLVILKYALMLHNQEINMPLIVYAPEEPREIFTSLNYKTFLQAEPIHEKTELEIGRLQISFTPTVHSVPSYLVTVTAGQKKFVYSGDSEYFPAMPAAVEGADLFLCEANFLEAERKSGASNHLTAAQAGQIAREGGVKRLILTHLFPDRDPKLTLQEAQKEFAACELAQPAAVYQL